MSKNKSDENSTGKHSESKGSLVFGFFLLFLMGVAIAAVGIVNLKGEVRIYRARLSIKSHGKGTLGTIISSEKRYGSSGSVKKRYYTYYLHTVRYDGFEKNFQSSSQIPFGVTVPVLYLPEDPEKTIIGNPTETISDIKSTKFSDIFGLSFGLVIYSVITIIGSCLVLLLIIRGIQIGLGKDNK